MVTVYVANAFGAPFGVAEGPISNITNAVPGLLSRYLGGMGCRLVGKGSPSSAACKGRLAPTTPSLPSPHGSRLYSTATTVQLNNTVAPGVYAGGGTIEVEVTFGMADAAIQATCIPEWADGASRCGGHGGPSTSTRPFSSLPSLAFRQQ